MLDEGILAPVGTDSDAGDPAELEGRIHAFEYG
jgi:hypothetical protein